ncbi:unnamed protein product [Prunus armeniaca]|uniref:non-specific serine/threonine protein kinase n=1 Tax=Prunus armeniaca TaxID=36596 RepID=A0A6J5V0R9_PRUAR|nr:unnamed protein product [Prunus armeniaca]
MLYTDWPNGDYEHFLKVNEDFCRQSCLSDCFCAIAVFDKATGGCLKKGIPLSNGRIDQGVGWISLIKVRIDNSTYRQEVPRARKKENSALILVGSVLMIIISYLIVSLITYLFASHIYSKQAKVSKLYPVVHGINLKCFTYMELKEATNRFKEELGRGAFATVFKGVLASNNGRSVAVKRLDSMVRENDLEFKAEVSAIGRTNHRNLVQLLGFCNEGQHRILVYEFMTNGSLASFLFGESMPSWDQRREIALGTARGLLYLHEECSSQIIHCDIKPQNILLDDSFTARIADFGVAKLLQMDQTRTTTRFRGTKGYMAPEWFKSSPVTVKVDVYSFGILLLEIICCRKHYEPKIENEDQMILADWAYACYKKKTIHMLLENDNGEEMGDIKMMEKYAMIAFWCIQEDPSIRPTMKNVTQMLEGTIEVSIGKDGFLLAIWFNKITERTIVWSANGNNLVPQGSQVELTSDGQFMLNDATGKRIWYAESAGTGVAYAAMLDTGNFVLANQNSSTLWQSFDQPTDTILPTQTLNQNSNLYARYTATNYSKGRFLFALQSDGNLALYTTNFPQDSVNSAYWSTKTDIGFQVIFNQSGLTYLASRNGSVLNPISPNAVSIQDFYQRATLEYDGVLRHYVYPKSTSSSAGRWPVAWSTSTFVPPNICLSIVEGVGGGACGFNSLCRLRDEGPICQCPNGYNSIDPNDAPRGCKQNFVPQSCDQASPGTNLFYFQEM